MKRAVQLVCMAALGLAMAQPASAAIDAKDIVWAQFPTQGEINDATPLPAAPPEEHTEIQLICKIVDSDGHVRCMVAWVQPPRNIWGTSIARLWTKSCRVDMARSRNVYVGGTFFTLINIKLD
jgi:hypothetical protein